MMLDRTGGTGDTLSMGQHDALLNSHPVLRTRDLDEARAAVAARYCDHKLDLVSGRSVDVTHNHARGAHVSLNFLGYGADVAINPGELHDFYLLQIPLTGTAQIAHRGEVVAASPDCATILNPDRPSDMIWRKDCKKLMVQIDADFLGRVATEALAATLPGPVRFAPSVYLRHAQGQQLRHLSLAIAKAIEGGHMRLDQQGLSQLSVEREIAMALIQLQPSNISHLLRAAAPVSAGHAVSRAICFMHDCHHDALTLDAVARAAKVHPRTLQIAFRQAMGCTPMQFLRDLRLDKARYHLMRRTNRMSVSEVAYDCGYAHLGRFSRDYKARFGQAPRDTC